MLAFYLTKELNEYMDTLSDTFFALADPTRRAILAKLAHGEANVSTLARPFHISAPAISRHLRVLQRAGLIERRIDAKWRYCRLRPLGLRAADDWLSGYRRHWEESLDRLADYVETGAGEHRSNGPLTRKRK
jgi:DNA-binding transcriptional ArsR family regulator